MRALALVALIIPTAAALQPTFRPIATRAVRPASAARLVMQEAETPSVSAEEQIKQEVADMQAALQALDDSLMAVADGPSAAEQKASIKTEMQAMQAALVGKEAQLEALVGPPPKVYSAVARMRLKDGTMGGGDKPMDASEFDLGKLQDSIMPTNVNYVNIGASLAVVVAAAVFLAP